MTVCGSVTGAKLLSSKKLLSEPDVYCPPNSQFVFIEKARSVGCSLVRVMPPTSAISGSAATPAPPIRLACSTARREIRRLAATSCSSGLSSALTPAGPPARGGSATPQAAGPGPGAAAYLARLAGVTLRTAPAAAAAQAPGPDATPDPVPAVAAGPAGSVVAAGPPR